MTAAGPGSRRAAGTGPAQGRSFMPNEHGSCLAATDIDAAAARLAALTRPGEGS